MARKLRIQYPGAIYHVMNRGDHQERIFCDDQDRQQFLATLEEGCQKTAWQVHSFCLMSNHFRLVVETPTAQEFKPVVRGWCVGSEQFRADMLKHVEEQRGKWHYGAELSESAQAKAEQLVTEVLLAEGVPEQQIARWRKGHPLKVSLAARLRAETTVTLDWIAKRLRTGTRGHLAHLLYLHEHARSEPPPQDQPRLNI